MTEGFTMAGREEMTEAFTLIPNIYIDEYMPELSCAELKVLIAIFYRTAGQQRGNDEISIEQLQRMTGLSRNSIRAGLRGLLKCGLVVQMKAAEGGRPAYYKCVVPGENE